MPDYEAPIHRLPANGKAGPALPTLVIRLEGPGSVSVGGPIRDRVLAYGMLGAAYEAVMEYHRKKADEDPGIITGTPGDVPPTPPSP